MRGKIFILTILIIFLLILVSFLAGIDISESRHEKFETSESDRIIENIDSDGDLLCDQDEIYITNTDPNNPDSDGDGITDGQEYEYWEDFYSKRKDQDSPQWLKDIYPFSDDAKRLGQYTSSGDLDGDGIPNIKDTDSDGDGLSDGFELANGLDPGDPKSNLNSLPDSWRYLKYKNYNNGSSVYLTNSIFGSDFYYDLDEFPHNSVLFKIEPVGYPRYWRAAVFDSFYKSGWRSDYDYDVYDNKEIEFDIKGYSSYKKYSYTITFERLWKGNLPTALHTTKVNDFKPDVDHIVYSKGGVFNINEYIKSFSFNSSIYNFDYETLSDASLPVTIENENLVSNYMIPVNVINLGRTVASNESSPFDKAYSITEYLINNYIYDVNGYENNFEVYKENLKSSYYVSSKDSYPNIIETMLYKTGTGNCLDFATAFVLMCRANDIPSRLAVGFTPGEIIDNERVIKSGHYHAWGEILLNKVEWLAFEVTPSITVPGNTTGVGNSGEDLNIVVVDSSANRYFGGTGGGTANNNYQGYKKITENEFIDSDFDGTTNYNDPDDDNDGILDLDELNNGTNPIDPDTDDDGINDFNEVYEHHTSPTNPDTDNDGLSDYFELEITHTNPLKPDTDGGGANDGLEYILKGDPLDSSDDRYFIDSDYDGLSDGKELEIGTDPNKFDTDGGGADDYLEFLKGFDPLDPSDDLKIIDSDYDGLMDQKEIDIGTDRFNADTDGGGAWDGIEYVYLNDPQNASDDYLMLDNDHDNLINKLERIYGTNENVSDTDYGGVPDGVEVREGYNPLDQSDDKLIDSDDDELTDYFEYKYGTDPYDPDTDNDGLSDWYEINYFYDEDSDTHLNPNSIDTDSDSLPDDFEIFIGTDPTSRDTDGDGLDDNQEIKWGSSPALRDTDNDGLSDYDEVKLYNTNPILKDSDGDGIDDYLEDQIHTDPNMPDSDGDGVSDYLEHSEYRTSPIDPDDRPGNLNERITPDPFNNPETRDNDRGSSNGENPNTSPGSSWNDNNGGGINDGNGGGFSLILIIIGILLIIIISFYYLSWRKRHVYEITEVVEAVEKELTEIKDDFETDEVRQAIFRAYKSMLRVMEKYDFTRKKWMTPREFEALIRSALPIDEKYIVMLTNIFEEARYSNHLMTEDFKTHAIDNFRAIKMQLYTYNKGDII